MSKPQESRTVKIWIDRHPDEVYAYAADPRNMPAWGSGIGGTPVEGEDGWTIASPAGTMQVEFAPANTFGVLDHVVTLPDGTMVAVPMRVLPNAKGSDVHFEVLRLATMTDADFARDIATVEADLAALKRVLEG